MGIGSVVIIILVLESSSLSSSMTASISLTGSPSTCLFKLKIEDLAAVSSIHERLERWLNESGLSRV